MNYTVDIEGELRAFILGPELYFWHSHADVLIDGDREIFFNSFLGSSADLLATCIKSEQESRWDPIWREYSITGEGAEGYPKGGICACLLLFRLSRDAAALVLNGIEQGLNGNRCISIPSLIFNAGLLIEDVGGDGSFTPPERIRRWYDNSTWCLLGAKPIYVPGFLHYPIKTVSRPLPSGRVSRVEGEYRLLYVSPVGAYAKHLLPKALQCFSDAGADSWLIRYDQSDLDLVGASRIIECCDKKWPLGVEFLKPDDVSGYDYIFFWDDDIDVEHFDPKRFVKIMAQNHLSMAQPAIMSPFPLSHAITARRASPTPRRSLGSESLTVVGRITNFVEIMVAVYSREAWVELYDYLDKDNGSGWGYDYVPLGRKGIVDAMPVTHTRPVQSYNLTAKQEMDKFLDDSGLFKFAPGDCGWLYEMV